ncbi:hypothetical protein Scep_022611 [Stephania cephalantha]|uniref:UspA domain-containing protein n=1 Tax=Stephania cephalantha TaxID=152367 RepID=A0AAP0FBL2_9MAGN
MAEIEKTKKKKVMVAIDANECSHYALEWALENLIDHVTAIPLTLFTVQSISDINYIYAATHGSVAPELIKSVQEQQSKLAAALLERAKDICSGRGVIAETMSLVGDPKEAICEAVEKFKVELLVLGNQGKGTLKRTFLGSVSNYCVQHANCPVLVVKKPV